MATIDIKVKNVVGTLGINWKKIIREKLNGGKHKEGQKKPISESVKE
jgi:hypothetical protein